MTFVLFARLTCVSPIRNPSSSRSAPCLVYYAVVVVVVAVVVVAVVVVAVVVCE